MSHPVGLVEETAAASKLEEAQVLVYTAARELPGQVVTNGHKEAQFAKKTKLSCHKNMGLSTFLKLDKFR